jgi:hypothetical protein
METQLDKEKLNRLLKLHGKNYTWLANNLGWTRQRMHYHIKNRTLKIADKIAPLFGLKGRDMMK